MVLVSRTPVVWGQLREASTVQSATDALNEFVSIPNQNIPRSLLARAEGLVVVPGMLKVGLIGGVRRGKGIVLIRDQSGAWQPPLFATMTGGSIGWQAGVQATDVVLVFLTRRSVSGLLNGKFTIGADAAAAAGPVGRQAAAATDGKLQAEILSYSRSRGLFAGVSVDGSVLQIDQSANQAYYAPAGITAANRSSAAPAQLPPTAARLLAQLASLDQAVAAGPGQGQVAESNRSSPAVGGSPVLPSHSSAPGSSAPLTQPAAAVPWGAAAGTGGRPAGAAESTAATGKSSPAAAAAGGFSDRRGQSAEDLQTTRQSILEAAAALGALLDRPWRLYLALPEEVFSNSRRPSVAKLDAVLERFARVTADDRYEALFQRQEFQRLHQLLQVYRQQLRAVDGD
jgi:lipid-binding SYLF domain-containing protein